VLGLHLTGPHASDVIAEGALAVALEATVRELAHGIHAHPTLPRPSWRPREPGWGKGFTIGNTWSALGSVRRCRHAGCSGADDADALGAHRDAFPDLPVALLATFCLEWHLPRIRGRAVLGLGVTSSLSSRSA